MNETIKMLKKMIAQHHANADDLSKMKLKGDIALDCRNVMVSEEQKIATKLEFLLKRLERNSDNADSIRNCDRFNTNNAKEDFNKAIAAYEAETGESVYNASPGYDSSGDFIIWLLSRKSEMSIITDFGDNGK